ncbi:NAD-dependent epimerase/dehydratase family protein [Bacillus songklensis]|uniref:NAD-dependent epimerase/dehydratase family protein n=1 Tax=Bacillus songklensis TaxID=1069116 RepID=A0ABV8B0C4_9BACI
MKKVAVIGANRFVGFCLCDHFLKEGLEVTGYIHQAHDYETALQEEMELFLGRNANFTSERMEEKKPLFYPKEQFDAVYFTFFDQGDFRDASFFREKIKQGHKALVDCISYCLQSKAKLVFLSSLRVYGTKQEVIGEKIIPNPDHREGRLFFHFEKMVTKFTQSALSYVIIRVPTVYGPWQPFSAAYQQACIQLVTREEKAIEVEEDRRDVLFIDDVVYTVAKCTDASPSSSIIHLYSGQHSQWEQGADLLNISYEPRESKFEGITDGLNRREKPFAPYTSIREGVQRQKHHTRQLFSHYHFL